jgi:hypothetical protein
MAHAGQFGIRYTQVVDRFFHALEWRYNEIKDKSGHDREIEILSKLLDVLLADQVVHDTPLHDIESALAIFQKVRRDSYTPKKYEAILHHMGLEEGQTHGYRAQLFGSVVFDARAAQ